MLAPGKVHRRSERKMADSFIDFFRESGSVVVPEVGRQVDLGREPGGG
jgi:hypothetical protein